MDMSTSPRPGLLWVTSSVKDLSLPIQVLHDWYDEHTGDYLDTPGNGRLFLRYRNIDPDVSGYADPEYASPFTTGNEGQLEKEKAWPFLALLRLDDVMWLTSEPFLNMNRHSALLPPAPDGGRGYVFDYFHAGLRSYETIHRLEFRTGRPKRAKHVLSIQTLHSREGDIRQILECLQKMQNLAGYVIYKNLNGICQFQEPGQLPDGLVLAEVDSDTPPTWDGEMENEIVRVDVWELVKEAGDLSLGL